MSFDLRPTLHASTHLDLNFLRDIDEKCFTKHTANVYSLKGDLQVNPIIQWYTRSRNFRPKRKVFSFRLSVSAAEIKG